MSPLLRLVVYIGTTLLGSSLITAAYTFNPEKDPVMAVILLLLAAIGTIMIILPYLKARRDRRLIVELANRNAKELDRLLGNE